MHQSSPGGGAGWDQEPGGQPQRQPGDQEPSGGAPASNFPTFGRTPGWEEEPAPTPPGRYRQPYGQPYEQPSEQPSEQPYGQTYTQPYDQGYSAPGYGYEHGYEHGYDQPPATYPAYGAHPYAQPRYAETETGAIVALVLAILSWVLCPVLMAIPALVVGSNARAKIRSFPERFTGMGMVKAAMALAWANIGLFVGGAILIGVIAIVSAAAGSGPS
jgi:Domain of unknown function (DUF4190)